MAPLNPVKKNKIMTLEIKIQPFFSYPTPCGFISEALCKDYKTGSFFDP
jgi:hypothetical protein